MKLDRRRALRLRLRDLSAASAFAAVALSGSLPVPVTAIFLVGLVVSLLGFRPLGRTPAVSATLLLFTALVLFGLAFRGVLDLVVSAVSFATLVTAQRMISEPDAATDQQVLLSSLLLMAGAAALSGDIWYALCLFSFGTFACLALGMQVIEGPIERDEELPLSPVMRQVGVGVLFSLAGAIAFFVLFPRLTFNVAAHRSGPGLLGGTTGMTDAVRLGGGGDIKTSARVVLKARLQPNPRVAMLNRYWVGRHFDSFNGKEWRGTGVAREPRSRVILGDPSNALLQRIELLPAYQSRTLVGLENPVYFGPAMAVSNAGTTPTQLIRVGQEEVRFAEDANAYSYEVQSRDDVPMLETDAALLAGLTVLPANIDPRVAALARQIVGPETRPDRIARRIEAWLQNTLSYTLELPGEVDDPLADFLFNRKRGHCEHFATALAVLLRAEGVPSRVVGGFFGGELVGERYVVRAGDAHAWVEAYSPTLGWKIYDATPSDSRGGQPQALIARLVDGWEYLEELWRSRVVDYSFSDQWTFVRSLVRPSRYDLDRAAASRKPGELSMPPARAIAAALATFVLVLVGWRLISRPRRKADPATDFLGELERALTRAHIALRPGEDIESLPDRLRLEGHRLATPVRFASRRYLEARFGGRPLSRTERHALLAPLSSPKA